MIGKLRGLIDSVTDDRAILDVAGVGYVVFISNKTSQFLQQLPKEKEVSLTIETIVKEDAIELYGFANQTEKTWFSELTKVQGVGAKVALKILGFFTIENLARALISSDTKAFCQISGIGPKLASRITTELKDSPKKLGISQEFHTHLTTNNSRLTTNQITSDALSALENLGYRKADCLEKISAITAHNPEVTLENLITLSLRELSKNKF